MLIELTASDFNALTTGTAPQNLRFVLGSAIAPPEVLEMLRALAAEIDAQFSPSAWMIVEEGEIVGLCSIVRMPQNGEIHVGYGVAPTREGRGYTTRALRQLLEWARGDSRVTVVSAETGVTNIASQRVLERNGFNRTGERIDDEDGPLICWKAKTAV
ncbi:N-acetyltransferase [bacterium]|nr:MAG: N-acetyltransferase [bacterium]